MNVKNNPKTIDLLFSSFIELGEQKLGRKLSIDELSSLKTYISNKCEKIDKKDIVREIYNLQLAKEEKRNGEHINSIGRFRLKQRIHQITNCPIRFTSSSKSLELAIATASRFSSFELSDRAKRTLKAPTRTERTKLRDSYLKNTFHYKAPYSTGQKIRRLAAIGLSSLMLWGFANILDHNEKTNQPVEDPTQIVTEAEAQKTKTLRQTINGDILQDFKDRYKAEYNIDHDKRENFSFGLKIRSIPHTYLYKISKTDENGNEKHILVTHGSNPSYTADYLEQNGFSVERTDGGVDVISVVSNDEEDFYEAATSYGAPVLPAETILNDISAFDKFDKEKNTIAKMSDVFNVVASTHGSNGSYEMNVYEQALEKFYKNNPINALDPNVVLPGDKNTEREIGD